MAELDIDSTPPLLSSFRVTGTRRAVLVPFLLGHLAQQEAKTMYHGIVVEFFSGRPRSHQRHGFGFVRPVDGGPEVYFHASALQGVTSVPPGAEVTYILVRGSNGHAVQAANVRLVPVTAEAR